ncbi:hypothetical protein UY416_11605 [Paenibacillus polymyxa]|nr:hypothetical protein [Paenibacillus polymyxa]MDY8046944.1 hypothetical protein [Paenibacillus polymyxa]
MAMNNPSVTCVWICYGAKEVYQKLWFLLVNRNRRCSILASTDLTLEAT